jgi:hypothetical protein
VGAGVADDFGSDVGPSRVAAVVESARVEHVGWRERGEVDAAENEQAETAETARTREGRRRKKEGA